MKLSTRLFLGFVVISIFFTTVVFVNFRFSEDVLENSNWLARSQEVRRSSAALQLAIIDMEAGMRGFLLTGNEAFLESYSGGIAQLPGMFAELEKLVAGSPEQLRQLKEVQAIHQDWYTRFSQPLIEQKRNLRILPAADLNLLKNADDLLNLQGRQKIDQIRELFRGFNDIEYKIRQQRADRLNDSIGQTRSISLLLTTFTIVVGLGGAFMLSRYISGRIVTMVNHAETISQGNYKTRIQDHSNDELGDLSRSLNRMANTIDSTIVELEAKNKELDQFAYIVSHDLKAPLRGIDNASRWIEEDLGKSLPEHIQHYLHMMRTRVHRMENLINGILALARIGRSKELQEEVNVQQLLLEAIDLLSAPEHLAIKITTGMPVIQTVRFHLQQVFSNLLSNALKYHDKPAGLITVACTEDPENNHYFRFTVSDDGPGIDPVYHQKIFMVFQTLQERDAVESTGVGLAIVKKIVERHGGTIQVSSSSGQGASFIFTWPKKLVD